MKIFNLINILSPKGEDFLGARRGLFHAVMLKTEVLCSILSISLSIHLSVYLRSSVPSLWIQTIFF